MNIKITTVLFDLDGVLIDSTAMVAGAFDHTITKFGKPPTIDHRTKALSGSTLREVYSLVASSEEELVRMCKAHADFQNKNLQLVTPFSDTISTLEILRKKGFHLAVITNRSINARHIMEHCKLSPLIDLVVSVEDVKNPKPDPEGILKAMKHFGSEPVQTMMVGDMPVDILAGRSAGVLTVGMHTNNILASFARCTPSYGITSLKDLLIILKCFGLE